MPSLVRSPHRLVAAALAVAAALLLTLAAAAGAASLDRRTSARLDRTLARTAATTWPPGAIAGVWVDGRGWTGTVGVADRTTGARPRLNASTRIGSVTKTFTGTLILQLVDEGRLQLDDTIERWFPRVRGASGITVRQLGEMSSGIASYSLDDAISDRYLARPTAAWRPAELIAIGTGLPRRFAPGRGFLYSNTNLVMLGEIVEQETGRPLATVMREKLFAPLGMRHTTYAPLTRLPRPALSGYTLQGSTDGTIRDATDWNPSFSGAAGQITSTLDDLRRWTVAVGSGSLLRPATQRERLRPNPASVGGGRAYAFAIGTAGGWLMHSGVLPGYNTQVAYLPARRTAIVVLTNADIPGPGGAPAPAIFAALAQVVAPGSRPR